MHTLTLALTGLATFHWAFILLRSYYSTKEKEALRQQVSKLTVHLRRLKRSHVAQEQRADKLAAHVSSKVRGNQILWEAVENMTNALFEARANTAVLCERYDWERAIGFHSYNNSVVLAHDLDAAELKLANARREKMVVDGNLCSVQAALHRLNSMHARLGENYARLQMRLEADAESEREMKRKLLEGTNVGDSRATTFHGNRFLSSGSFNDLNHNKKIT